ncbi:MAG: histidine kinase [Dehalococcoidia bacterium]|nr:histidine kinase [Dehalococcoidia bacterium]
MAVGLILMLGIFAYAGVKAIQRSTALVLQERLAMVQGLAAIIAQDFQHILDDVTEDLADIGPESEQLSLDVAAREAYQHISEVDKFRFFKVSSLSLVRYSSGMTAGLSQSVPSSNSGIPAELQNPKVPGISPYWDSENKGFVLITNPLVEDGGKVWGEALINLEPISSPYSFSTLSLYYLNEEPTPGTLMPGLSGQSQYQLEVVGPDGLTLLTFGSHNEVGKPNSHFPIVKSLFTGDESGAVIHKIPGTEEYQGHVLAAAPIPGSPLYLILEQDQDEVLAVPNELRKQFVLLGGSGFLLAMGVTWWTTRRVVKPVVNLSRAAERIASGELSMPVSVEAQDELVGLSESLEMMRQKLSGAMREIEQSNQELEAQVMDRTSQLSEALQQVISAQEEERRRIARELHDETAQSLAALSIMLDNIRDKSRGDSPVIRQKVLEAKQLTTRLLEDIRRLIFDLRPTPLDDFGLIPALRWYAETHLVKNGISVTIQADDPKLPSHVEVGLFRIVQEAVNNITKHSGATQAIIKVSSRPEAITIIVSDNGKGFDIVTQRDREYHAGLTGMKERAKLLRAKLDIISRPGQGTEVRLEVPTEPSYG